MFTCICVHWLFTDIPFNFILRVYFPFLLNIVTPLMETMMRGPLFQTYYWRVISLFLLYIYPSIFSNYLKYKEGNNRPPFVNLKSLRNRYNKAGNKCHTQDNTDTRENLNVLNCFKVLFKPFWLPLLQCHCWWTICPRGNRLSCTQCSISFANCWNIVDYTW